GLRPNRRSALSGLRRIQLREHPRPDQRQRRDCARHRRWRVSPRRDCALKKNVDDALPDGRSVRRVIVFRRVGNEIHMEERRDAWWHQELEYVDANCTAAPLDSEHPLYLLYTSGSTGKPKGILHTTGGYLVDVYCTTKYVFDIRDEDIYWCTADV